MVYRISKWIYETFARRFEPRIPQELLNLAKPFGLNLYLIRFYEKKLSVDQVNQMLDRYKEYTFALDRIALKNMFLEARLMEQGIIPQTEEELFYGNKLWNHGQDLKLSRYQRWKQRGGMRQYYFKWMKVWYDKAREYRWRKAITVGGSGRKDELVKK